MKYLKLKLIFTLALISMCCVNLSREKKYLIDEMLGVNQTLSLGFLSEISPKLHETFSQDPKQLIILFFDGSCSACILEFLKFLNTVTIIKQVTYLYIASTKHDILLLEHHIEQSGRKLESNEYLLPDTTNAFSRYNPAVVTQLLPLLFLEKNSEILSAISLYSYKKGTHPFDK